MLFAEIVSVQQEREDVHLRISEAFTEMKLHTEDFCITKLSKTNWWVVCL
jgi:hypothetical protein